MQRYKCSTKEDENICWKNTRTRMVDSA